MSLIFARRLKQERELKGLTQVQMAEQLGINPGTLSGYERDYREPDFSISTKIANILGVDLDYLIGLTDTKRQPEIVFRPSELVRIPVLGTIRAGYDLYAEQHIIGYELISEHAVKDGDYFYLVVTGDSMIEEGIKDGFRVLVRRQSFVNNGKLGVVIVNGDEGTLKRVYYEDNRIVLIAANKNIPPRIYRQGEVLIQGQVVKVEFDV